MTKYTLNLICVGMISNYLEVDNMIEPIKLGTYIANCLADMKLIEDLEDK